MTYKVYNQLQGRAGECKRGQAELGLYLNLGGSPFNSVAAAAVSGRLN
jgi:acetyl-CoA C-acetyltransferase